MKYFFKVITINKFQPKAICLKGMIENKMPRAFNLESAILKWHIPVTFNLERSIKG